MLIWLLGLTPVPSVLYLDVVVPVWIVYNLGIWRRVMCRGLLGSIRIFHKYRSRPACGSDYLNRRKVTSAHWPLDSCCSSLNFTIGVFCT